MVCLDRAKARKRADLAVLHVIVIALALAAVLGQPSPARAQTPGPPEVRELVIGTKVAPPFAMKAEDGTWRGISIDLWQRIANQTLAIKPS
jgi:polar amino acid transport system substrate-binding protein